MSYRFFQFFSLLMSNFDKQDLRVVSPLSVVPLRIGKITVTRGKRTGKRRLFAKSPHFRGRILLRTGPHTQEGDYRFAEVSVIRLFLVVFSDTRRSHRVMAVFFCSMGLPVFRYPEGER